MSKRQSIDRAVLTLLLPGGATLTYWALAISPDFTGRAGFTAPLSWKLFFFHVPLALVSFLAFTVALAHSVQYLRRPDPSRDRAAHAAVEVGVLFAGATLVTGMIWAKAEWGYPWDWGNVKLTVVLVMFLAYAAYLFLRTQIDSPETRARVSALYATASFASVPLAWFANRIWDSYPHPTVFGTSAPDAGVVTPGVMPAFLWALLVFAATFYYLYRWRLELLTLSARIEQLETAEVVPT